jgi:threonine dehydrogenase-like Zn-dependent dehydrogenase
VLGILGRAGAFAERTALPLVNLVKVPAGIPDEDAVYAEPLAAVLRIREQVEIVQGARVAILGDGRLGLLAACVGIVLGWDVSLVGRHPDKMREAASRAQRFITGEAQGGSFDIAVDCTGSCDGLQEALRLLKPRGKLVLKTTVAESAPMNLNAVVINEVEIIGSRCGNMYDAVRFLEQTRFRPSILTTATYPLSRGEEAFRAAEAPENIKVLLDAAERG